jgi:cytochrome c
MRWIRGVGSFSALALATSLPLAHVHPFGDADLYGARSPQAPILQQAAIPSQVRAILESKCVDCHSSQTQAPIYGHFAPISWLLERDILEGRKHLDFSRWDSYSTDQQQTLEAKILQETKSRDMPLPQYRMIHWNARITDAEVRILADWAHGTSTPEDAASQATTQGDPTRGAALFEKRCTGCHSLTSNHEGPRLQGVYGRPTGSIPSFPYSDALKSAHLVWNDQTLEQWLTDPDAFLPGNNMDFHVPRAQERKDIIAYFKQSAGK